MTTALETVGEAVDAAREDLVALSHGVHGDAELGFEEHTSSARVAQACADAGMDVTHGWGDLDTAVVVAGLGIQHLVARIKESSASRRRAARARESLLAHANR